jgi:hypothetical protein
VLQRRQKGLHALRDGIRVAWHVDDLKRRTLVSVSESTRLELRSNFWVSICTSVEPLIPHAARDSIANGVTCTKQNSASTVSTDQKNLNHVKSKTLNAI